MLDDAIALRAEDRGPIGTGRRLFLVHVQQLIEKRGFPLADKYKLDACSMPFIFQELNYDDIDWSVRTPELAHLGDMVEIDVVVWSGGLRRSELTDKQYNEYWQFCLRAIDLRQKHKAR